MAVQRFRLDHAKQGAARHSCGSRETELLLGPIQNVRSCYSRTSSIMACRVAMSGPSSSLSLQPREGGAVRHDRPARRGG